MIFKGQVKYKDWVDAGFFDDYKVLDSKLKPKVLDKNTIRKIIRAYLSEKIKYAWQTGWPVRFIKGYIIWDRLPAKERNYLVHSSDGNVYRFKKRDLYRRHLRHVGNNVSRYIMFRYERYTREMMKNLLDIGIDVPLNNFKNEQPFRRNQQNFCPGGRYDARTPSPERHSYVFEPDSRRGKKASH
jgi:hypothetical protein